MCPTATIDRLVSRTCTTWLCTCRMSPSSMGPATIRSTRSAGSRSSSSAIPAGRGRPRHRRTLCRRDRLLGRVRGRQAGTRSGREVAVLHDCPLRRAPVGAATGQPNRRSDPQGADRADPGRVAVSRISAPRGSLAKGTPADMITPGPRPSAGRPRRSHGTRLAAVADVARRALRAAPVERSRSAVGWDRDRPAGVVDGLVVLTHRGGRSWPRVAG